MSFAGSEHVEHLFARNATRYFNYLCFVSGITGLLWWPLVVKNPLLKQEHKDVYWILSWKDLLE